MSFRSLTFDDSGLYQCVAANRHGVIYANAELRVFGESKTDSVTPKEQCFVSVSKVHCRTALRKIMLVR